jgi:aryl-alcohol dehydrogenase-like predicted oxidoreductase
MRKVSLNGLTVSAQGLGCMGMSEWYGRADWNQAIADAVRAIELTEQELAVLDPLGDQVVGARY